MPRVRKAAARVTKFVWRIAIYIRLSKEESEESKRIKGKGPKSSGNVQSDASGSVVEQEKMLTEWVQERFAEEDFVIVDYFVDDADIVRLTGKPLQSGGYRVSLIFIPCLKR